MSGSIGAFGIIIVVSVALLPEIRNTSIFPSWGVGSRSFFQTENIGLFVVSLVAYFITVKCSFRLSGTVVIGIVLDCESLRPFCKAPVRALCWRIWRNWRNFVGC
jgi:hypothetical protein